MGNVYNYKVEMKAYPSTFRMGGALEIFRGPDVISVMSDSSETVVFNDVIDSILDESSIRQLRNIKSITRVK